ncbi:MAG: DUF3048 domain-containing protein [Firmicutes bacterium]|nr:DUF3048 domain-containing protein [Bacillota bacterium]
MHTKSPRIVILSLLLVLCASCTALAAPLTSNTATMPMSYSTGAHGANATPAGKSPTTGLDWSGAYRPVFVQISNDPNARPHWNMSEADIVYEAIYWGPTYTRYSAVYSDNHPDYVGSIRSARVFHCQLREEWDCPMVFWGGQGWNDKPPDVVNIKTFFKTQNVPKEFQFSGTDADSGKVPVNDVFGRDRSANRDILHAAIANLQYLAESKWPANSDGSPYVPKSHAFSFSNTPTRGQDTAIEVRIPYDTKDHFPSYTFNAASRQYERWYNGQEQYDGKSGKRIVASNVIVQYCKLEFFGNNASRPIVLTTNGGIMDAFIDGQHIRGSWVRNTLADRTIFLDVNGNELTFLPGKTFIQIVPEYQKGMAYVSADGAVHDFNMGTDIQAPQLDELGDLSDMEKMG